MGGTESGVLGNMAWLREFAAAVVGAVRDNEAFVASDRARYLRTAVGLCATLCTWAAWVWLAAFVLYVAVMPLDAADVVAASAELGNRDALFYVLAIALAGPILLAVAVWLLMFAYRIVLDQFARRLPRVFRPLAGPAIVLAALAVQWSYRVPLHAGFWRGYGRFADVLHAAGQFTPVVQ